MFKPYQPFLLRIVHGITALMVILAMITAYWTYDVYDGRWGQIPLPKLTAIEGIHGTFGLWSLLIFPALVFYAFHYGQKRLIQRNTFSQLTQISHKGWIYNIHRLVNSLMLISLTFAVFSGKMMDEKWLPNQELEHFWYYAHLLSWLVMLVSIALHLLTSAKVGGSSFLLSMFNWYYKSEDSPFLWVNHLKKYKQNFNINWIKSWWLSTFWIKWLELIIWFSLVGAWLIPIMIK